MSDEEQTEAQLNDFTEKLFKFDENFLITLTKDDNKSIEREAKLNCKILIIPLDFNIDEVFTSLSAQDPVEYPNLFIFIIENQNSTFIAENPQNFQESLVKFGKGRPLIIQLTCVTENCTKFHYKADNSTEIVNIDQQFPDNLEFFEEWQNKLRSLVNGKLGTIESEMLKKLSFIQDSSVIFRFLRTLNLQEAFFGTFVLEIAEGGTKNDLLAVLDASFEGDGRILNIQAQDYIRYTFDGDESGSDASDESNSDEIGSMDAENQSDGSDQEDVAMEPSSESNDKDSDSSVLLTAIKHSNKEVIDYLITYWSHLIQQFPFKHQVRISTAAFETNQLDVLCDLLEISDFPFPQDFSTKSYENDKLRDITDDRMKFKAAIEGEKFEDVDDYINKNLGLKFIYNPHNNNSALTEAIKLKKFSVFYYLKSLGFEGENCDDVLKDLSENEKKEAVKQATEQRKQNIKKALQNVHKSVLQCSAKSLIHNRRISKEQEAKFREKIMDWFEDVYKIAPEMLDVAASCEHLKIIFDFESDSVENAILEGANAAGVAYPTSKWIFIGAKFSDKAKEQKIKGVLGHELCHYVMRLVYENQEFPYHKDDKQIGEIFKEVMQEIDLWSETKSRDPDDECNGIISTVYRLYQSKDFEPELIVRVVNILAQYDDDENKSKHLQEKYKILFDFWQNHVIPELQKYLQKNKEVMKLNGNFGLLSTFSNRKIEFSSLKDVASLIDNKLTIVTTNVPKLLLINIHKHLKDTFGCLLDSKNLFLEPEKLKNNQMWKDFKDICVRNPGSNIFIDCTKSVPDYLSNVLSVKDCNFIFIISNESDCMKVVNGCRKKRILNVAKLEMHYSWNDLAAESQKMLLQTETNFQNNYNFSLMELLRNVSKGLEGRTVQEQDKKILEDLNEIIDDQLLNLLVEKQEIRINLKDGSDSEENNFELLYQERSFVDRNGKNKISQDELLNRVKNKEYVLISDIAGTGKSWSIKNTSAVIRQQNPTRWVTFTDLKQLIQDFKAQSSKVEFLPFFVEKVLKSKNKFEGEIFKKLYKNGKVSIFFDAFDEIAPDCAEFVATLAQSFEFNGGNQLWIATRDYFEVDLQQKLQINDVFKLNEFTEKEGIIFIVASWMLTDSKGTNHLKSKNVFECYVKESPNFAGYHQKAQQIVRKVAMTKHRSVGLPQLFSMIADGFKDDKYSIKDLKGSKIFTKFAQNLYKKWSDEKGTIRKDASIESQEFELNFWKFHQYHAINSLFPEFSSLLFPNYDRNEWTEEEIIACGLMTKNGENFYFLHETFREFFAADFIAKALKRSDPNDIILHILAKILTVEKYGVIRMFLNDAVPNHSSLEKILPKMQKFVHNFYEMKNFCEFFTENLELLANFITAVLRNGDYEKVYKLLNESSVNIIKNTRDSKVFLVFQKFLFDFLKAEDLKCIVKERELFQEVIGSNLEAIAFENFVAESEAKLDRQFIQERLKLTSSDYFKGNIFYFLLNSPNFNACKVQKCLEKIQTFLTVTEIIALMKKCNSYGQNILELSIEGSKKFNIFWTGAKHFLICQNLKHEFKRIVKQKDSGGENILHWASKDYEFDIHESLWDMLQSIFEDQDELKDFILQKDGYGENFVHLLVTYNKCNIIELTFNLLKENLSEQSYREILRPKGNNQRNLLQVAANSSKEVKTHQILWNSIQSSCKSVSEFSEILKENDANGNNVFNVVASYGTSEILKFMHNELENCLPCDEIKTLFSVQDDLRHNILQLAVVDNTSVELHEALWIIIKKYFDSSEILEFIKHIDMYEDNLLIMVIQKNTKDVIELTWREVRNVIYSMDGVSEEQNKKVEQCDNYIKNILESLNLRTKETDILKFRWIENNRLKLFDSSIHLVPEKFIAVTLKDLMHFILEDDIKNHENLWENLTKKFQNRTDLKNLLSEKTKNGNNFIHLLVIYNKAEIIEFTIKKLKIFFDETYYREILRSKGCEERNLLQKAAVCAKEVKTHQILWKDVKNSCKSKEEFLEILNEVDEDGDNVFHLAAAFTTGEIFEFMNDELTKIASEDEHRKLLKSVNKQRQNLLQRAAYQNESLELHEALWKVTNKHFNSSEILEFIKHLDIHGDNLLITVIMNTKEVIELTLTEIKKVLSSIDYVSVKSNENIEYCENIIKNTPLSSDLSNEDRDILKMKWVKAVRTLEDLVPFLHEENVQKHEVLWKHLTRNFIGREKLKNLLTEDKDGNNFFHLLVIYNKADVIEFTFEKLKENLSEPKLQEILRSKGSKERNLLQTAAECSKEVKKHQILWKASQNSCKSNEEFLEILNEVDEDGNTVFNLAACFTTGEIFEFMEAELAKIASKYEIRKLQKNLDKWKRNLLQSAAQQNKSLKLHEALWKIIKKYFDSSEILEFTRHLDIYGNNLFINVTERNTKEIKELTWKEVKKVLNSNNCGDEELIKNIERCDEITKNAPQSVELKYEEKEFLKLKWMKNENTNSSKLFDDVIQQFLKHKLFVKNLDDLKFFMADENVGNHEAFWNHLLNIDKTPKKLKKLLTEKGEKGNNFIHFLVIYNKAVVIEFTFEKLKENLIESQYQEILRSEGEFEWNLLQIAARYSKEVKKHQILWKAFQDSCKSNEEFLEILKEVDEDGDNVFNLAACFTTGEIFEFMEAELVKIATKDEIRKILKSLDKWKRNLLQQAALQNKSLEFHEVFWKIIKKYFNSSEVLEFIKQLDVFENNLLIDVTKVSTKEIIELTWKEIKKVLNNNNCVKKDKSKKIERCDEIIKNILQSVRLEDEEKGFLKLEWIKNEN